MSRTLPGSAGTGYYNFEKFSMYMASFSVVASGGGTPSAAGGSK